MCVMWFCCVCCVSVRFMFCVRVVNVLCVFWCVQFLLRCNV